MSGHRLRLELHELQSPLLRYDGNRHDYDFGGYTYYYSRQHMSAKGEVTTPDRKEEVVGEAWFDRQWGDLGPAAKVGWDWFCIQLDGGARIMVFNFHRDDPREDLASVTDGNGTTTILGPNDYEVRALAHWTSPHSGNTYPSLWDIRAGTTFDLRLEPLVADQEILGRNVLGPNFWEGACSVRGTFSGQPVRGRAYAELQPGWVFGGGVF